MNRLRNCVFVAVFSMLAAVGQAKNTHKLASELIGVNPDRMVDVIVTFKEDPADFHRSLVTRRGGELVRSLELIRSHHYRIAARELAALSEDPAIEFVHPDRAVQATGTPASVDYARVGLLELPSSFSDYPYDGSGVTVALIDSGISTTHDLGYNNNRVVYSQSFVPGDASTGDTYGHGTHVAGIIGGDGSGSDGRFASYIAKGLAPNVKLVNLRVLDQNGASTDSAVIAAIQRAVSLKTSGAYNIRVVNLSLGRPVTTSYKNDPLCQAVEAAWKAGIVVVVAAGNDGRYTATSGYGTILSPANDPFVISVGAMNTNATQDRSDDKMASYSAKGPTAIDHIAKPDLVAPGNRIVSLLAPNSNLLKQMPSAVTLLIDYIFSTTQYFQLSGTSMAAPMVSGTAALLFQQNSNLTPDQVKARLMLTADKTLPAASCDTSSCPSQAFKMTKATDPVTGKTYKSYYDMFTIGAGYLDSDAALNSFATPAPNLQALSPVVVYNSSTKTVTLINGASVTWGSSVTWGTSVIWGTNVMSGNSVTWGTTFISGSGGNADSASSVIWGNSVTWGGSDVSSESLLLSLLGEK